tara:strand:- start:621 stop:4367 length:3747 start_codon:yes stop_codon:yes gene_type:complete
LKNSYQEILDPNNILLDDRSISDSIILLKKLATAFSYYNRKNKLEGNFSPMIETDQSFLIAEISEFSVEEFNKKRLNFISKFDNSSSLEQKRKILIAFSEQVNQMFTYVNNWYTASRKNNFSKEGSTIETELEQAIESNLAQNFNDYINYLAFFKAENVIINSRDLKIEEFESIVWKSKANYEFESIFKFRDQEELINNSFKKMVLISSEVFEIIYDISYKTKKILRDSLYNSNDHKAHIGLLFSFLELMNHVKEDVNGFSQKHLDFYYKNILKQTALATEPLVTFVTIDVEDNSNEIFLSKNNLLIAGQYADGAVVKLELEDDVRLNTIKISDLLTIFISRNAIFDYNSKFQLISSIYYKSIASTTSAVNAFNSDETTFSTMGRDQNFLTTSEMTMSLAEIGFLIASPVLKLGCSDRKIKVDLNFSVASINYLSDLIIDIANTTDLNEDEVFYRVFSSAFEIQYTILDAWHEISDYEVLAPDDWTSGTISILLSLTKIDPAFVNFDSQIHSLDINTAHPVLRININQTKFYNTYSFLNTLELIKIDIDVEVENLKQIKIYRDGQLVDNSSDFDLLGPLGKYGSKVYIGCEELFNKKATSFDLSWDFTNIPPKCKSIDEFYKAYKENYSNNSFKLKLSALSDFNYRSHDSKDFTIDLFKSDKNSELENTRQLHFKDLNDLKINPNFNINDSYLTEFSNDIETGLLKIELIAPIDGFGFDIYPKLYSKELASEYSSKKSDSKAADKLNEPFAPTVNNIKISYKASTSIVFNDSDAYLNDPLEGNSFFQTSPFGIQQTFSQNEIRNKNLFYNFFNEGELIIGLSAQKIFSGVNLLFEINKSENTNYEFSRKIEWYYSSSDGWKKMENEHILFDQTFNLMKTGIISFRFPVDFSKSANILDQDKYYIKACSADKADQFSLIKSIKTNASKARELVVDNSTNRIEKLKANSVEGFEKKPSGILSVSQPFDSSTFKIKEDNNEFYLRVSQLLRHKNRPVTKWDIENFILNRFDWLTHVSCFNYPDSNQNPSLKILCLKRIEAFQNIEEVKLSMAEINDIKQNLANFISPFLKIEIINPVFEDIWIKAKLTFRDISIGKGIEELNHDLLNFICDWRLVTNGDNPELKNKIKKYDIIKFIKERKYISFVTGISVIHFKELEDGSVYAFDSASQDNADEYIECGSQGSILVPRNNHKITILSKDEYHPPEPTNFDELAINKSFLIVKKQEQKRIKNNYMDEISIENKTNIQFQLKL